MSIYYLVTSKYNIEHLLTVGLAPCPQIGLIFGLDRAISEAIKNKDNVIFKVDLGYSPSKSSALPGRFRIDNFIHYSSIQLLDKNEYEAYVSYISKQADTETKKTSLSSTSQSLSSLTAASSSSSTSSSSTSSTFTSPTPHRPTTRSTISFTPRSLLPDAAPIASPVTPSSNVTPAPRTKTR